MGKRFKIDRGLRREVKAMPCFLCEPGAQRSPTDPCHIRTFGSSGIDAWWNMVPMCREHHEAQHRLMWKRFCDAFPKAEALLKELGWVFIEAHGRWRLVNEKEKTFDTDN